MMPDSFGSESWKETEAGIEAMTVVVDLRAENKRLLKALAASMTTIHFFRSVIQSGEKWTIHCVDAFIRCKELESAALAQPPARETDAQPPA